MKRLFAALCLLFVLQAGIVSVAPASPIPASNHLNVDITNGVFDSRYPNSNTAPTPISWNLIAPQTRTSGSSYSINMRSTYLVEPGGSAIGVTCVLPSGWTLTTDGLSYSGTGTGSTSCSMTATLNAVQYVSDPFLISAHAADALAPTIPANLYGVSGSSAIDWYWDAATDQNDGTNDGSGVKEYDLAINGAAPVVITDPNGGPITACTSYNIGSISSPGAPIFSQSGTQWTLTAAGTGIDGTADQAFLRACSVTGDFVASVKVSSITNNANQYSPAGLMARGSSAAGAQYMAISQFASGNNQAVQGKGRAAVDGAKTTYSFVQGTDTARWVRLARQFSATSTEQWTLSYSLDGTTYTALQAPIIQQMPSTLLIGTYLASMTAGTTNTAVFNDFSFSQRQLTYHQTTTSASTAKVRARDLSSPTPNVSAYGALTPTVTPSVNTAPVHKWHPGQGVLLQDHNTFTQTYVNSINTTSAANIVNVEQIFDWSKLESTKDNYTFAALDAELAAFKAIGRNFVVQIWDTSFGGTGTGHLPAYLATLTNGNGGWFVKPAGGVKAKNWVPAVNDREIALVKAICDHLDGEPYFEGVVTSESDPADVTTSSDWNATTYSNELIRANNANVANCPHTNVWPSENFVPTGPASAISLLQRTYAGGSGYTGPDVMTGNSDNSTNTDRAARGLTYTTAWVAGGFDYRGLMAIAHDVQGPELGGKEGGFTMTQLYNQSFNVNKDAHVFWLYKTTSRSPDPPADLYWSTDILPFLAAGGHPTRTACPTGPAYAGGCYSGH